MTIYKIRIPFIIIVFLAFFSACGFSIGTLHSSNGPSASTSPSLPSEPVNIDGIDTSGDNPADYVYVRAGLSSPGNGSSWSAALAALPSPLVRGKIYWLAGGSYNAPDFSTIANGEASVTIRQAGAEIHGSDDGWDDSFAASTVDFPPLYIHTDDIIMECATAKGITIQGTYQCTMIDIRAHGIILKNLDLDGNFAQNASYYHIAGAGYGMLIEGSDIIIAGCDIHGVADDAATIYNTYRLIFARNNIYDMFGCGTDRGTGPCNNGHSDGLELIAVHDSIFDGNFIKAPTRTAYPDMTTAAVYFNDVSVDPSYYNTNLTFCNNVFYRQNSFAVYVYLAQNIRFYNNVIWGRSEGGAWGGGLVIGNTVSGLEISNNILFFIRFDPWDSSVVYNSALYSGSHNLFALDLGYWPLQDGDIVNANPGFSVIPAAGTDNFDPDADIEDFSLDHGSIAINKGMAIPSVTTDAAGNSRPIGGGYDI
jgi:hypothetical protein